MLFVLLSLTGCATTPPIVSQPVLTPPPYDYPLANPYAATIIGTPVAMQPHYTAAKAVTPRTLVVFPGRKIPEGFWYYNGLQYGEMLQDHPASLIYIIGGTGSGYNAHYNMALANMLYQAGHHVVLLPSPTHSNFIVTASSNFSPGNGDADAADLYRVITMIQKNLAGKVTITSTGLTGYSLGAWHAAFTARLDSQQKQIGFAKVLLLNPPLNVYNSLQRLDALLYAGLPDGINGLDGFINRTLARLSRLSPGTDALDFSNSDLLLDAYLRVQPPDSRMKTLIGVAFRLAAADMVFTADVMSHAGYIYPKDRPFRSTTPLDDYLAVALRTGLTDYFQDIYRNHYLANGQLQTVQALAEQSSLLSMGNWISADPDIGLITNQDDIVLAPGEIDTLKQLFAGRDYIFPTGGHLGNLEHRAYAYQVTHFFQDMP